MIIILCLDNNNGMMFNDRRQSQDRGLREYIAEMTKGEKVYMNAYTEKLYEEINDPVVCEDFLHKAGKAVSTDATLSIPVFPASAFAKHSSTLFPIGTSFAFLRFVCPICQ